MEANGVFVPDALRALPFNTAQCCVVGQFYLEICFFCSFCQVEDVAVEGQPHLRQRQNKAYVLNLSHEAIQNRRALPQADRRCDAFHDEN
eukprot:6195483-Pleurochrysis_carterae.AAC.2